MGLRGPDSANETVGAKFKKAAGELDEQTNQIGAPADELSRRRGRADRRCARPNGRNSAMVLVADRL
jgi:hypothetical protein